MSQPIMLFPSRWLLTSGSVSVGRHDHRPSQKLLSKTFVVHWPHHSALSVGKWGQLSAHTNHKLKSKKHTCYIWTSEKKKDKSILYVIMKQYFLLLSLLLFCSFLAELSQWFFYLIFKHSLQHFRNLVTLPHELNFMSEGKDQIWH